MFILPLLMIPFAATPKARQFAQLVGEIIDAISNRKTIAADIGIKEALLSEWIACTRPLQFQRFFDLPEPLRASFLNLLLKRLANWQGGEYLEPHLVTLLNGAAQLPRPMVKMQAEPSSERKVS
jgi:hypothetical protein